MCKKVSSGFVLVVDLSSRPSHPVMIFSSCIAIVAVSFIFLFYLYRPTLLNILRPREFVSTAESVESTRAKLPNSIREWRCPSPSLGTSGDDAGDAFWRALTRVLGDAGFVLWKYEGGLFQYVKAGGDPLVNGFGYLIPYRARPAAIGGGVADLRIFRYLNPLCRAARTAGGMDVVIRVIVIGHEGKNHLKILDKIARGKAALHSTNHALPLFQQLVFEDIVFGVFPKIGARVFDMVGRWAKNSLGDVLEMVMQMLEGVAFIHSRLVAHRDVFLDNFLVQWHPESLATNTISPSRPRIYLTDFEVAIEFALECTPSNQVCTGLPIGPGFATERYARRHAPEFASGRPYNPFKLDIWQLGTSLVSQFRAQNPTIDRILLDMTHEDPEHRSSAQVVLDRLRSALYSIPAESLLVEPYTGNQTVI